MNLLKPRNNASITMKSLISTMVSVLAVVAVAAYAAVSVPIIQRAMETADAAIVLRSSAPRHNRRPGDRPVCALYRSINLKVAERRGGKAIVHRAKTDAMQAIDRAHKTAAALNVNGLPLEVRLVTAAANAVDAYAQAANQAASFAEDDAFNATMFMTDAEQKYADAQKDISALPC